MCESLSLSFLPMYLHTQVLETRAFDLLIVTLFIQITQSLMKLNAALITFRLESSKATEPV